MPVGRQAVLGLNPASFFWNAVCELFWELPRQRTASDDRRLGPQLPPDRFLTGGVEPNMKILRLNSQFDSQVLYGNPCFASFPEFS